MIPHSKRMVVPERVYLEHCRIFVEDGRVVFATQEKGEVMSLPYKNMPFLLLGSGTSITNSAARLLASQRIPFGFCGAHATPSFTAEDIVWQTSLDEYGPSEYMQEWARLFFDEERRLQAAKHFMHRRIKMCRRVWDEEGYPVMFSEIFKSAEIARLIAEKASVTQLLALEGEMTKKIYAKFIGLHKGKPEFVREHGIEKPVSVVAHINKKLDRGNYLAYGFGASALAALGIPHGFPVMHGKTRRGGLVFDVADLIKDAIVLPHSFLPNHLDKTSSENKQEICNLVVKYDGIDYMIDTIKQCIYGDFIQ